LVHAEVTRSVEAARTAILQASSDASLGAVIPPALDQLPPLSSNAPLFQREYLNAQSDIGHVPERKVGEGYERPSAYLRSRCAACFGGPGHASSLGEGM
jgi:hypothetical protein